MGKTKRRRYGFGTISPCEARREPLGPRVPGAGTWGMASPGSRRYAEKTILSTEGEDDRQKVVRQGRTRRESTVAADGFGRTGDCQARVERDTALDVDWDAFEGPSFQVAEHGRISITPPSPIPRRSARQSGLG